MFSFGWGEILLIFIVVIFVVGPKDIPIVLKKIGGWIGSIKRYFNEIQKDVTDMESAVEEEIVLENKYSKKIQDTKKDE